MKDFRFAIASQKVAQRTEPLLHGGELLPLPHLGRTLRVLDFRRYGAHALLAVVEIVDEVAYTAFQMAIDDFCHNVKVMKRFGVRGLLAGFRHALHEGGRGERNQASLRPVCCCKYSENKWNTECGKGEKERVSYILLQK